MMLAAALLLAQGPADTSPHSKATVLTSVRSAMPGKSFTVVLRIAVDSGWHTYWENPGDSGSATSVAWKLPKGWKISGPRFSTPHRIVTGDIVTYGYEKEASLMFTVTPPPDAKSAVLKGEAQWLVCQETCIPASYAISLNVPISKLPTPQVDLSAERGKTPQPFRNWTLTATKTAKGYKLRAVNAPTSLKPDTAYFFPSEAGVLNHGAPQTFRQTSNALEADLMKSPYANSSAKRLKGVLVLYEGGPALLVDVPVT
jgi:thiol:disulfide interchange protein DsbD